jgi:triosephosphate isomerase (TIM)
VRTPLIAGNWKMFKTHLEAIVLVQQLAHELANHDFGKAEVAVCPPFTALRSIQTLIDSDRYAFMLGAQNMHFEQEGAFTGEISAPMLASLRVHYVILGHSERRLIFGETDDLVNSKAKAAIGHGLVPILCCGETEEERGRGETERKVAGQVAAALQGVTPDQVATSVIAYEPIWAIGTGKTATPEDAQATIAHIRRTLADSFGTETAERTRVLYGGSVKAGNASALMKQRDIDGALVGGASLDPGEFATIVKASA